MRLYRLIGCAMLLGMASCSQSDKAPYSNVAEEGANDIPLKEFMGHVVDRNASQLWAWTTYVSDENGQHYTRPQSDKDWINAESDALTMVQLSHLLASREFAIKDDKWARHVAGFREAAQASAEAAETHDFAKLETAATELDRQCVACHITYVPQIEGPQVELQ